VSGLNEFPYEATKVGVEFGLQIEDNPLGATLGAEDDVRKKMTEDPTHISYTAPLGLKRLADILPTACAVGQ
jgi:hypothetical protein